MIVNTLQIQMAEQMQSKSTLLVFPQAFPTHSAISLLLYNILKKDQRNCILWMSLSESQLKRAYDTHVPLIQGNINLISRIVTKANLTTAITEFNNIEILSGLRMLFCTPYVIDVLLQRFRFDLLVSTNKFRQLFSYCALIVCSDLNLVDEAAKKLGAINYIRIFEKVLSVSKVNTLQLAISRIPSVNFSHFCEFLKESSIQVRDCYHLSSHF
jgi:hypothetical protein